MVELRRGGIMKKDKLCYCTKCGAVRNEFEYIDTNGKCFYCKNENIEFVPDKYITYIAEIVPLLKEELEEDFIEDVVKKSPNFNQESYEQRIKYIADRQRQDSMSKISSAGKSTSVICPYCNSSNVSKISTLGRSISVGLFGLASGKVGKQWHCNGCKSDF